MGENNLGIISVIIFGLIFVLLPIVNNFYQKRADDFADNVLLGIPEEYNKQIKGNAYRYLIGRSILGFLSIWLVIYNILNQKQTVYWFIFLNGIFAVGFFASALYGYKSEIKKIKELK
jgi:hypothetical protein